MFVSTSMKRLGVMACVCGLLSASFHERCMAAPQEATTTAFHTEDVVIDDQGLLVGRVISQSGRPIAAKDVEVMFAGGVIASVQTDSSGTFRVAGLREGVHAIRSGETTASYRLWPRKAAPPKIQQVAHVTCCDDPPPARNHHKPFKRGPIGKAFAAYPLATTALLGAGLGAAIAIPIATSQKPASP